MHGFESLFAKNCRVVSPRGERGSIAARSAGTHASETHFRTVFGLGCITNRLELSQDQEEL
jgi:hypothetical protein